MALITCPDCNNEISKKAISCPHCGRPINNAPAPKAPTQYGCGTLMLVGFVIALFMGAFKKDPSEETASTSTPTDYCTDTTMARLQSERFVKARLKSPATADFPFLPSSTSYATSMGGCTFNVISYVDSQNSFGAQVRTSYAAKLKYDSATDTWQLIELAMD